ncbi:hypothetical protein C3943_10995 [Lysinibacillus sp. B2A1]|nr:hypothetical protein C3943_10995 [Lysinibacillus sp. B2A1]
MSLSKRFYESSYYREDKVDYNHTFESGQRFEIINHSSKSVNGLWEVLKESNLQGSYFCNRVLKNGKLSKSDTRSNFRTFNSNEIYDALSKTN